ncbi:MAG TPA: hypothetical protein VFG42_02530 [Baekduia sp.]|uniref:hypothetical protein n=1 Tax=Baekduia sp. TaxID=2600305 RepID=UPI002D768F83|nr:hypothetical protein [Baekduia sp.]HET6505643.1 hypothetical protein [Baekduia sp.]
MRYSALFAMDDPEPLVGASLACPSCLSEATRVVVGADLDGRSHCMACGTRWSLTLEPQQLLRLSLDPPVTADVRFSRALPESLLPPPD